MSNALGKKYRIDVDILAKLDKMKAKSGRREAMTRYIEWILFNYTLGKFIIIDQQFDERK